MRIDQVNKLMALSIVINPIQDVEWRQKGPPYQFFLCNFCKRKN